MAAESSNADACAVNCRSRWLSMSCISLAMCARVSERAVLAVNTRACSK